MSTFELEPFTFGGVTWQVTVTGRGMFTATSEGFVTQSGTSYEMVTELAKSAVTRAKIKVSVPYTRFTATYGTRSVSAANGTATGIHAGNGNVLAEERGKPQQVDNERYNVTYTRPMTPGDQEEYITLRSQVRELTIKADNLAAKYKFLKGGLKAQVEHEVAEELARRKYAAQEGEGSDA